MATFSASPLPSGIRTKTNLPPLAHSVELFGHVTLVEGYAVPGFVGCHALVALRDTPGTTVAVMTTASHLQSLLETALATRNLIALWGEKLANPPTPRGRTWAVDVYAIDGVIMYNMPPSAFPDA
ncbi:MAG: hypothetical protein NT169_25630 [Chloroflexi bacterium]|nr:hypothetical protein [Chloroflexota bacterium]